MKKISAKINSWRLGHKLLCAFLLVSVLPILFTQIFAFQVTKKNMMGTINELMVNNLTQISQRVSLNLQVYSSLVYQIYKDDQIIANVQSLTDSGDTHKAVIYNRIVNKLKQYGGSVSGIRCLAIVCPDGSAVVYDFENDSSLNTIWDTYQNMCQIPPYRDALDAPGMVVTDTMRFLQGENQGHFFHISKRLFDFNHLDQGSIGTVTMTIDQSVLEVICNSTGEMLDRSLNFIMNQEERIICYPDEDFTGITVNPNLELEQFVTVTGYLRNRKMAINQYLDPATGWIYCNAYDSDYMLRDIYRIQGLQIAISVLVLLFAVLVISWIVKGLDTSVRSVVRGMREVQKGNLDVVVPVQSFREIGTIADNFNDMTVKVKDLIREVGEVKEQQKDAEIRALEAQINPHFLYNTLDSINWMAIEQEEYEISRMVRDLGAILRYSVNKSNQLAPVREVEDWLEKYVGLMRMRFDNTFSCEINVEPEIRDVKLRKLLLQPFVENAIVHGLRDLEYGGRLRVDLGMAEDKKSLVIIVEDNGRGMESEIVETFNDKEQAIRDDGRGIGLHNAFSRMRMYYGDAASWQVSSILGMGTVITLRLPLTGEDAGNKDGVKEHENRDYRG